MRRRLPRVIISKRSVFFVCLLTLFFLHAIQTDAQHSPLHPTLVNPTHHNQQFNSLYNHFFTLCKTQQLKLASDETCAFRCQSSFVCVSGRYPYFVCFFFDHSMYVIPVTHIALAKAIAVIKVELLSSPVTRNHNQCKQCF